MLPAAAPGDTPRHEQERGGGRALGERRQLCTSCHHCVHVCTRMLTPHTNHAQGGSTGQGLHGPWGRGPVHAPSSHSRTWRLSHGASQAAQKRNKLSGLVPRGPRGRPGEEQEATAASGSAMGLSRDALLSAGGLDRGRTEKEETKLGSPNRTIPGSGQWLWSGGHGGRPGQRAGQAQGKESPVAWIQPLGSQVWGTLARLLRKTPPNAPGPPGALQ